MGITGLIRFIEKSSSEVHLKNLRGCTVAVDTYCWLHKGVFSCAEKLVRGEETDLYILYCLKYVEMLLSYDIKPILVFDGQHLPAKALTEKRRRESRQLSKKRAAELLRVGRIEEARSQMRRCVDVTHEMALRLIRECRKRNIDCIVAPYEADAQMAWFNKVDIAQYIVTEDSDLTLFGARKIIFKLDLAGNGLLVEADKLHLAMNCSEEKYAFDKFRRMCILSGCDYLDSLPGIGLAKACKFILKTGEEDIRSALKKIPQYLNMRNLEVSDEYVENFFKAEATFKHMYIYNPIERRMERLNALSDLGTDERYCSNAGTLLDDNVTALNLALGNLNPFTFNQLDNWHPDRNFGMLQAPPENVKRAKHKSIWQSNFTAHSCAKDDDKTQESCAIYFKKVDFLSKTIDAEIETDIKTENDKPAEAEVYTMYSFSAKRQRCNSPTSISDRERTPPPSPAQSSVKSRHNPFAKDILQPSPIVCENSSLLRLLSPKKSVENEVRATSTALSSERQQSGLSTLKRSIFANESKPQVEVRSRFFATNVEKVSLKRKCSSTLTPLTASTSTSSTDLSNEIDEIEQRAEQIHKMQAQLYSPPSTNNTLLANSQTDDNVSTTPSRTDSGVDSTASECSEQPPYKNDISATRIIISDDSDGDPTSSQSSNNSSSTLQTLLIKDFQCQSGPRLGLSKTKSSKKKTSTKTAKFGEASKVGQNQTRLSMFGFQKRPVLK